MASLVVQVIDVEDVGPAFVAVPPVTPIREDVPLNTFVLQGNLIADVYYITWQDKSLRFVSCPISYIDYGFILHYIDIP